MVRFCLRMHHTSRAGSCGIQGLVEHEKEDQAGSHGARLFRKLLVLKDHRVPWPQWSECRHTKFFAFFLKFGEEVEGGMELDVSTMGGLGMYCGRGIGWVGLTVCVLFRFRMSSSRSRLPIQRMPPAHASWQHNNMWVVVRVR